MSLAVSHAMPGKPTLVLGLTILASWLWDWASDDTRREWRTLAMERAKAMVLAAMRDKDNEGKP